MEHTASGADRSPGAVRKGQIDLIAEIAAFADEYGDILARYHRYTMDDLCRIEGECRRLQDEARRRETWGIADELAGLEYLIDRAKAMRAARMAEEDSRG
ncbi:MAG TPA: hypothetical protein PLI54_08240 [Methanoculleus sp.]|jgi:hypothetical protein|uniref:hypothetical protein n=1 Tax=Methanoculleus sp. TaxID=90427 RepID=UPI000A69C0D8|nr:hypothetical protein [Methanoculleus sp.]MBP7145076.1 hypothetical protein [Methanoculleus sp.]HNT08735.1 hypothetical protein [Methanoculleus sp.]HOC84386.1 hypothetical protein [Methanoculleus sp.]HOF96016.1 hypothetical protein [Methanoculleus sp.]HOI61506.1 hypothetical protein [Methanoculleus sp.]